MEVGGRGVVVDTENRTVRGLVFLCPSRVPTQGYVSEEVLWSGTCRRSLGIAVSVWTGENWELPVGVVWTGENWELP